MSTVKLKLEKLGLKRINQKKEEQIMNKILGQQYEDHSSHVRNIIPNLIKMTK
jgi:protein-S-isoprenylcysteine O-methyltransferase Ste14